MARVSRTIPRRETEEEHERCRTWGHVWDDFNPKDPPERGYGQLMSLRCVRCTTMRYDWVDLQTGAINGRKYEYADGYIVPIEERMTRGEMRLDVYARIQARLTNGNGKHA